MFRIGPWKVGAVPTEAQAFTEYLMHGRDCVRCRMRPRLACAEGKRRHDAWREAAEREASAASSRAA